MWKKVIHRAGGQVRIRGESVFPERILNLCGARNIAFWDLTWESSTTFSCTMSRRDWKRLQEAATRLDCTLTVLRQQGGAYALHRFHTRPVLMLGLMLCSLGLFLGSFFIWQFEITGNTTVPDEHILRALEKCGVKRGTFGMVLVGADIRNHVLLDLPELIWLQVNVSGCRAYVEVRERREAPEMMDDRTLSNVVARRPGLILKVKARAGLGAVCPGEVVEEGQLLISGVEDTGTVGASLRPGQGSVTARTWYTLRSSIPLCRMEKRYTGREKQGYSLIVGTRRLKFFANSSVEGADCDKLITRHSWSLFGIPLPLTWERETFRFYEPVPVDCTPAAAAEQLENVLREILAEQVAPWGTVRSALATSRVTGERLEVQLTAECREEIGVRIPLYQEITDSNARKTQE